MPSPSPIRFGAVLAAVVAATLGGCAHDKATTKERLRRGEHAIRVNATATAPVKAGTPFVITPARDPGTESTLLYAETARLVKAALMAKGMYEAPSRARAGVIVEVEYAMETPKVSRADPPEPGQARRDDPRATDANVKSAQRGPLEKSLVLTAREAKSDGPPRTLWSVELSTVDASNDLRKYLPLLAATAIDQIGVDSDGPKTVKISETDKTVALVRAAR